MSTTHAQTECSRAWEDSPCGGEVRGRTSRSGLTYSLICDRHRDELDLRLDAIESRYPEVNHPDSCTCYGCSDGSW